MPTLKQKTVNGTTYQLKRYRTDEPGKQFEYYITADGFNENGRDRRFEDETFYTRSEAMQAWNEHLRLVREGAGMARAQDRGPSLPGMGGGMGSGDGPSLPGFGPVDTDGDGDADDDDELFLPGF